MPPAGQSLQPASSSFRYVWGIERSLLYIRHTSSVPSRVQRSSGRSSAVQCRKKKSVQESPRVPGGDKVGQLVQPASKAGAGSSLRKTKGRGTGNNYQSAAENAAAAQPPVTSQRAHQPERYVDGPRCSPKGKVLWGRDQALFEYAQRLGEPDDAVTAYQGTRSTCWIQS